MTMPLPSDSLLACLEELCRFYHRPRSAAALKVGLPLRDNCLTPETFVRAAERSDLDAEIIRLPLGELGPDKLPAVLLDREGEAFLALAPGPDHGMTIWEPRTGEKEALSQVELDARYAGRSILVRPQLRLDSRSEFQEPGERAGRWFWGTLLRYRKIYLDTILASLVVNLLVIASPIFTMNVYDRVVPNRAYETLWVLAVGVLTAFVFELLLRILRGYFVDQAGKRADIVMSSILYERVMGLRLEDRPASAGAMANTFREFESLRDFFTSATLVTLVDLPFLFVFIFVIWIIGGPLFWIPLLAVPFVTGIGIAFQPALNKAMRLNLAEVTQKQGLLVESVNNLETVKGLCAEGTMQRKWEYLVEASSVSSLRSKLLAMVVVNLTNFSQQVVTIALVVAGVYLIEENLLTTGGLIACTILGGRAMAPLAQVSALFIRYQSARHALTGLNRLVGLQQERPQEKRYLHRPELSGNVAFENVSFVYPGQQTPALQEIGFEINAGDRVAILGRVGSGKSTLLKLLLGLYRPTAGTIRLDGIDQGQIDPVDLRRNFGYVDQDTHLFFGTLRENIAIADPEADDAAVLEAAKVGGVEEFARRHPQGYDMRIGEGGAGLSGGQKQCVAIARAVLTRPNILALDEPTSGMDQMSEALFIKSVGEFLAGRTLFLVTHKPSMMALVDKIILMDGGRVVATGPRDMILRKLAENERKGPA